MMIRFLSSSRLHDQNTFYTAFERDLLRAQYEVVIESPFITTRRMNDMIPLFAKLRGRDVSIVVNTRNPEEHSDSYYHQALSAVIEMQELGIKVLYTTGHHRKLAIIDREVIYEGSLNILSFSDSCEIMRRIVSSTEAVRLQNLLDLRNMLDTNKDFDDLNLAESDEAIEAALNYLRYHDPANADREYATGLLKFMNRVAKEVANKSDLNFEAFVAQYNESLKKD